MSDIETTGKVLDLMAALKRSLDEPRAEVCESESPQCGPVMYHDADGIPLCAGCYRAMMEDYARQPDCPTCHGRAELLGGASCPDCSDGKDWLAGMAVAS